jgi:small-conductance mechanosensitive channel
VEFFDRLKAGLVQLAQLLPPLFFALVILVAGFVVARMAEKLADAFLGNMQFDRSAERWGVQEAVERTGMHMRPTRVVGKLLFWLVMLVVILLASSALGVQNVNDIFANLVGYIPSVFAAIIVIVFGMLLGEFVRALILASAGGVEGVPTLAKLAKVVVITISSFMALQQLGVAADIVTTAFTLILGAAALAFALAFGLGNTVLAGEITRRWYEAGRMGSWGRRSTDVGARREGEPGGAPPASAATGHDPRAEAPSDAPPPPPPPPPGTQGTLL